MNTVEEIQKHKLSKKESITMNQCIFYQISKQYIFVGSKCLYECILNKRESRKGIYREIKTYPKHNGIVVSAH